MSPSISFVLIQTLLLSLMFAFANTVQTRNGEKGTWKLYIVGFTIGNICCLFLFYILQKRELKRFYEQQKMG